MKSLMLDVVKKKEITKFIVTHLNVYDDIYILAVMSINFVTSHNDI